MTCPDSLAERFGELLHRISPMQLAKRWSELLGTFARLQNGMTRRAVLPSEQEASPDISIIGLSHNRHKEKNGGGGENHLHHQLHRGPHKVIEMAARPVDDPDTTGDQGQLVGKSSHSNHGFVAETSSLKGEATGVWIRIKPTPPFT